jgi:antitoxin FitA
VTHLVIRDLPPPVAKRLAARAAQHGTTIETEARTIIEQAVSHSNLADLAQELFGLEHGVELELPPRQPLRDPPDLG